MTTAPPRRRTGLEILRDRDFGPYFVGNALSGVGTWIQNIAAALLVFELTHSTLLVGVVNFAQYVSSLLLASWSGAAADRFDRRRLLIVTQVGAAVVAGTLAAVTLAGAVTTPILVGATALLGLSLAFMAPATLAMVPLLVPRVDLDTAVSLNSASFNLARAVGPVLAAVAVERLGYGPAFGLNAVSFAAYAGVLVMIRTRPQVRAPGRRPRLRESVATVRANPLLVPLLVVVAAASIASDPVYTLAPEFALRVLGGTTATTGFLVGAFGTGAVLTAVFVVGRLQQRRFVLDLTLGAYAVGTATFALAPTVPIALAGMALAGAGFLATLTRATARIQSEVPDELLGRVMALWSLCFIGSRPLAALVDGAVADFVSPRVAGMLFALVPLAAAAWIRYRVRPRLQGIEDQSAGGGSGSDR